MRTWRFCLMPLIKINQMANLWWHKSDCLTTWTCSPSSKAIFFESLLYKDSKILLLHLWMDSRSRSLHYSRKEWHARKSLDPGVMNVENQPLVKPSKILLLSIDLKLGLMKNYVKVVNQEDIAFTYLWEKVPQTKWGKIERRCFHWSTNTRPYQGWILGHSPSRRLETVLNLQ